MDNNAAMLEKDYNDDFLSEYTPIPFWFWNDELSENEILRQMKEMKDKGVEGFVIHPRKGLPESIKYLSDEYFHYVKFAVIKAKEMNMKVVLYDEAMYPSGSCRGEVVRSCKDYASKGLLRVSSQDILEGNIEKDIVAKTIEKGEIVYYVMVPSGGTIRGIHPGEDDGEVNAPKSTDLLNPKAVARFIELTHEKYYRELSEYFGNTIIAFFTDEPNILGRNARQDIIPWSEGLLEEFEAAGGNKDLLRLLFEKDKSLDEYNKTIEIYQKVIYNRLSNSYYKQLSNWCTAHGIDLTGHPEKSTDIGYLQYFQRPCQDIVWRFVEPMDGHAIEGEHSTMGKCSSDSARHRGKRRNGNECFGCCSERDNPQKFTDKDMRWYLNWLFVRGVNLIYPHAFYYSLRDGRGDERPPEVGLNNPYWPQYHKMSDFIKRMCYLNTDSCNHAQIAILCGYNDLSWKLAKPLFTNQIEFNYLEKELLSKCFVLDGKLNIKEQKYSVLLIEGMELRTLDNTQRKVIDEFERDGGTLIVSDESYDDNILLDNICQKINRDFIFDGDTYNLRFSHLYKDDKEFLLLSNEGMEPITFSWASAEYKTTSIWNPYTLEHETNLNNTITIEPCDLYAVDIIRE